MKKRQIAILAGSLFLLFGAPAQTAEVSKEDFIKTCNQECATSANRHKSNVDPSKQVDQCRLVRHYADMFFDAEQNKVGAELILKDVCPKALEQAKAASISATKTSRSSQ